MNDSKYIEIAAQLWCLPKHQHKEMDADLAGDIAAALSRLAAEKDAEYAGKMAEARAAGMGEGFFRGETAALRRTATEMKKCNLIGWFHALTKEADSAEMQAKVASSLLAPAEKGKKSACVVCAGGEPGNENLIQGVPLCDDCSHIVSTFLGKIAPAEKGERC